MNTKPMETLYTLENKTKFFAQYWLQDVLCSDIFHYKNRKMNGNNLPSDHYLELTPLSQITDEDVKYIWRIEGYVNETNCKELIGVNTKIGMPLRCLTADYLRSKGYALPWMNVSVEEQIEFGWIKLKEN